MTTVLPSNPHIHMNNIDIPFRNSVLVWPSADHPMSSGSIRSQLQHLMYVFTPKFEHKCHNWVYSNLNPEYRFLEQGRTPQSTKPKRYRRTPISAAAGPNSKFLTYADSVQFWVAFFGELYTMQNCIYDFRMNLAESWSKGLRPYYPWSFRGWLWSDSIWSDQPKAIAFLRHTRRPLFTRLGTNYCCISKLVLLHR